MNCYIETLKNGWKGVSLMDDEKKKSFVFMESYREALELLETDEEKYRFVMAIINYGLYKQMPDLSNESKTYKMAWLFTQPHLDSQTRKKGGQPGNKNAAGNHTKKGRKRIKRIENESPNVNDNVNVNVNDNVNSVSFNTQPNGGVNENKDEELSDEKWMEMIKNAL